MKKCQDCAYAIFQDEGYSNYTVDGTSFNCAKGAHPDASFDRYYFTDERLNFADKCPQFHEGKSINMDVDEDNVADLDENQRKIWDEWNHK